MSESKKAPDGAREVVVESMDDILGTSAAVALNPEDDKTPKNNILDRGKTDLSFLDNPEENSGNDDDENEVVIDPNETDEAKAERLKVEEAAAAQILIDELDEQPGGTDEENEENEFEDENENKNKGGRKPALVEALNGLVAEGVIQPFKDQENLEDYTIEDAQSLIKENIRLQIAEAANNAPLEVFKRLPQKIQDVVSYALNGGTDITNVLKEVSRSQEITELNLENDEHHEKIVREWLRATEYGDDTEIEDEITALIDRGDLSKKAGMFKPKLDAKQSVIMQKRLDDQEAAKDRAASAAKIYDKTIHTALNKIDLNGIPLDEKTQTMLYYGMVDNTKYQDRNGNATNALGHLIEEYQFGENANPSIILEALWLLADPEAYRNKVRGLGKKEAAAQTFRELKGASEEKITSSSKSGTTKREVPKRRPAQKSVARPNSGGRSIFSRTK